MHDVLVIGAGPAALALAAALCDAGLRVAGLAPDASDAAWPNTYGIWADELEPLGLTGLLGTRWEHTSVYAAGHEHTLGRAYGLFDNLRLQTHLLTQCERGGMAWRLGAAADVEHSAGASTVATRSGERIAARLVVDASGHKPALLRRQQSQHTAFQAAYGIVGVFSHPPVRAGQLMLMDYRAGHLAPDARSGPPTFLYAMDLGDGRHFVEETSLAHAPPVSLKVLEQRLHARLAAMGVTVRAVQHVERCLFPMNSPLPYLEQAVMGYGAAAGMVHPASGYQVGAALRHAPAVAQAIAAALGAAGATPQAAARAAWQALWPRAQVRRRTLYLFGLASLLRLDQQQTEAFFGAFFRLPRPLWTGYLSNRLNTRQLLGTMLRLFIGLPQGVRAELAAAAAQEHLLLRQVVSGRPGA